MNNMKRAILGMALVSLAVLTVSGTASADDHHGLPSAGGDGYIGSCAYTYEANPNNAEVSANVGPNGASVSADGAESRVFCGLDPILETRTM